MIVSPTICRAIAVDIAAAEDSLDRSLASVASLIATLAEARRETGVDAGTGHATMLRLAETQLGIVRNSGAVLRAHRELLALQRELCGPDTEPECPEERRFWTSGENVTPLRSAG